jgi:hypothetical protein
MDIILVHIGKEYPIHIEDCIHQLKKYKLRIHLLISEVLIGRVPFNDIIVSKVEDYIDNRFSSFNIRNYDKNFRDGFWFSTSARFFIIDEYTRRNNITNYFHVENDNLIYSDLTSIKEYFLNSNCDMFLVIDSETRCIPSIMFIKNCEISNRLCNHILRHPHLNDMENLFNFYKINADVDNLPIVPDDYSFEHDFSIDFSNHYDNMLSIFDGAAIGQYLGGVDPRNNPNNTIGFINETTVFNPSKFQYVWINNEPYIINSNNLIKVINLHIHSKNLKKFMNHE